MKTALELLGTDFESEARASWDRWEMTAEQLERFAVRVRADAADGLTFNAFAAINRLRCELDFHRTLDATNDHSLETWALKLCGEAGEVAEAVLRLGGKISRKAPLAAADVGDELSDVISYCALIAEWLGLDFEQVVIRKWNAVSERVGSALRIEPETPLSRERLRAALIQAIYDTPEDATSGQIADGVLARFDVTVKR